MTPEEKQQMAELLEKLKEQDALLERLLNPPFSMVAVIKENEDNTLLVIDEHNTPKLVARPNFDITEGELCVVSPMSGQIINSYYNPNLSGKVVDITSIEDNICEIESDGRTKKVIVSPHLNWKSIKAGDKGIIDFSENIIINHVPAEHRKTTEYLPIRWNDIGGLKEQIRLLREAVERPYEQPSLYKYYNLKPPAGILLYGEPGCGKTMLANALANSLMNLYSKDSHSTAFQYIKGAELLNPYVGVTEREIRKLFAISREHYKKHKYPSVMFIDEAEALLPVRGSGISSDVNKTIVPMFLSEMSGLDDSHTVVILSTNRPSDIDPAVARDGRVDLKLYVPRPDEQSARDILTIYLSKIPLKAEIPEVVDTVVKNLYSEKNVLYELMTRERKIIDFKVCDVISGSSFPALIDKAVGFAIRRDIQNKKKSGVTMEDINKATEMTTKSFRNLNHDDDIKKFVENNNLELSGVRKVA